MRPRHRPPLALHVSERIDDAAEQYRLGELRGRQRDIRKSKHPAQTNLRAEQTEDPRIKAKNRHGPLCAASPLRDKAGALPASGHGVARSPRWSGGPLMAPSGPTRLTGLGSGTDRYNEAIE